MRHQPRRSAVLTAAGAALLTAIDTPTAAAGQARASLAVTVRVVAACGGSTDGSGTVTGGAECPAGSAPLAITTETLAFTTADEPAPTATIEGSEAIRYLTLIY